MPGKKKNINEHNVKFWLHEHAGTLKGRSLSLKMSSPCNWDVWLCWVTHRQSLTPQKAVSTLIKSSGTVPWARLETSLRRLYYETLWRNTSGNQPRSYVKLKNLYILHPALSWTALSLKETPTGLRFSYHHHQSTARSSSPVYSKMLKFCNMLLNCASTKKMEMFFYNPQSMIHWHSSKRCSITVPHSYCVGGCFCFSVGHCSGCIIHGSEVCEKTRLQYQTWWLLEHFSGWHVFLKEAHEVT